jgi:hypothetical protein
MSKIKVTRETIIPYVMHIVNNASNDWHVTVLWWMAALAAVCAKISSGSPMNRHGSERYTDIMEVLYIDYHYRIDRWGK